MITLVKFSSNHRNDGESNGDGNQKGVKCYQCGKLGHIRNTQRFKLKGGNVTKKEVEPKGDEE